MEATYLSAKTLEVLVKEPRHIRRTEPRAIVVPPIYPNMELQAVNTGWGTSGNAADGETGNESFKAGQMLILSNSRLRKPSDSQIPPERLAAVDRVDTGT